MELEYPCLVAKVNEPWNFDTYPPCINLSRIGDGISDCLYSDDERNIMSCQGNDWMMGFNLRCEKSQKCINYDLLCKNLERCPQGEDDILCRYKLRPSNMSCFESKDFLCLNNTCLSNARCNGIVECDDGEDEYWCSSDLSYPAVYRNQKLMKHNKPQMITHAFYPIEKHSTEVLNISETRVVSFENKHTRQSNVHYKDYIRNLLKSDPRNYYLPFVCGNDGLAVKYQQATICFCPPNSYGDYCEYSSDRITILTHLNFVNYKIINSRTTIQVLLTFLYENRVIDTNKFHVQPQLQNNDIDYVKQRIYFVYPRTKEFIDQKRASRNGTQKYHVRFEVFLLNNSNLTLLDVWDYPIYFDVLPSYRLAKILKLDSSRSNLVNCSICGDHGMCHAIVNNNKSTYCNCHSGYYGQYCNHFDSEQCQKACSSNSICRPNQRGILNNGERKPYCLCLPGYYGSNCYLKYKPCENHSCENGGTCFIDYTMDDIDQIQCVCHDSFYGTRCELLKHTIYIQVQQPSQLSDVIQATVVQYYDLKEFKFDMFIREQQLYRGHLPSIIQLNHGRLFAPAICLIRIYSEKEQEFPNYFIGYSRQNQTTINITIALTDETECRHALVLLKG
ncbi:unnamed protein product [Rotaria sp. Silwood2]|nr:unnamed protein product [Rotaria sp. Silwood2]CAF4115224.1 unnamed protein product [Rotaria sp. Silwood2]